MHHLSFHAMGTHCRVALAAAPELARALFDDVLEWVAAFEARYSRYLPDSLISKINAAAGIAPVPIDVETERIFALCDQLHFISQGVFDPTALPLIQLWDWRNPGPGLPDETAIDAARSLVGWRQVRRQAGSVFLPRLGMAIDLGGMGKEYAVDAVARRLEVDGVTGALIDFGADVHVRGLPADGRPGWHIGLDDPRQPGRCWTGLGLRGGAVATSGDYLRHFQSNGRRYGHILDIRTGYPVENECRAVSVIAPSCTQAGLLSTSAFVLGPVEGLRLLDAQLGVAGAIVMEDRILASRRFYEHVVS